MASAFSDVSQKETDRARPRVIRRAGNRWERYSVDFFDGHLLDQSGALRARWLQNWNCHRRKTPKRRSDGNLCGIRMATTSWDTCDIQPATNAEHSRNYRIPDYNHIFFSFFFLLLLHIELVSIVLIISRIFVFREQPSEKFAFTLQFRHYRK